MAESHPPGPMPSVVTSEGGGDGSLRRSEERLRLAIEAAELGTWDWDLVTGELVWSERCLALLGLPTDIQMSYERFLAAVHPEDREAVDAAVRRTLDAGVEHQIEMRTTWPDGSVRWVRLHGRRYEDSFGCPVRMSGVAFDITDRKRTESASRPNEDCLLRALEAADLGTWDLDLITGRAVRSLRHDQIFGYRELQPEWSLEVALRHVLPEDRQRVLEAHTPAPGKTSMSVEARIRRSDGSIGWLVSSGRFHFDSAGRPVRIVGVVADITDRKKAEEALRQSEEQFRTLTENLQTAVALVDEHGAFRIVNSSFLRLFDLPQNADILNLNSRDWSQWQVFGEDGSLLALDEHPVRRAALSCTAVRNQLVAVKPPSSPHLTWLLVSAEPVLDGQGKLHRLICTYYDITDRKRAEEALRESEERFRLALKNAPVSVAAQDRDLRYVWAYNQRSAMRDEIVGHFDHEIFTAEQAARFTAIKRRVLEEGVEQREQMWLERPGGRMYLDICWEPIRDSAGRIAGVASATVDLTPVKLAEEALAGAMQRLSAHMDNSPLAIVEFDSQFRVTRWSAEAEKLFGWTAEEILGRVVAEMRWVHEADAGAVRQVSHDMLAGKRPRNLCVNRNYRKDGTVVECEWYNSAIYDSGGRLSSIASQVLDISERKRAERALRERETLLRTFFESPGVMRGIVELVDGAIVHVSCNAGAAEMYGIDAGSIRGKPAAEMGASEEVVRVWTGLYEESRRTGRFISDEYARRDAHGNELWLLATAAFLGDGPTGNPRFAYSIIDLTGRKRAEEALRQSLEQLQRVLEVQTVGVMFWDLNTGSIVDANDAFLELTGYTRAEVEARELSWQKLTPPEYMDVSRAEIKKFMTTGRAGPYEKEYFRKDGTRRWLLFAGSSLGGNQCVEFCVDISGRKRAEEALRESESVLRSFFDAPGDMRGIVEVISENDVRHVADNVVTAGFLGLTPQAMRNRLGSELGEPEEILRRWIGHYEESRRTGNPVSFDYADRRGDKEAWLSVTVNYLGLNPAGEPRFAYVVRDISGRRQAEEALRESEERLRVLGDNLPDSAVYQYVHELDGSVRFLYCSAGIERISGVKAGEVLRDAGVLHGQIPPEYMARLVDEEARSKRNLSDFKMEVPMRRPDGELRWMRLQSRPRRLPDGRTVWDGVQSDITEQKKAEDRLRQTQKLESIGLLAGGIAHDFNNLLTGVMGNASLLLEDEPSDRADALRSIIANTERAAHLTRQLLAYSGKGQFVIRELDVSQAVNEMADLVQFSIPKSADLRLDLQRRLPPVAMDPGQLQQILMNLVINAGEAIGDGNPGRIAVTTSMADVAAPFGDELGEEIPAGRYVCIEVSDTGSGIDPEKKAKIFDPFFTTKFVGRGLGLAAIAGILRSQKGGILVESAPGRGSTFRVFLPAAGRAGLAAQPPGSRDARPVALVVDDEVAVRDFIGTVLRRKGFHVVEASDGQEALAAVGSAPGVIEAAVVDIIMPNMSANELLPALKAKQPGMRILLTSGYSEAEARRLCAAYPGAAFIQKPYTAQQLAKAVDELGVVSEA